TLFRSSHDAFRCPHCGILLKYADEGMIPVLFRAIRLLLWVCIALPIFVQFGPDPPNRQWLGLFSLLAISILVGVSIVALVHYASVLYLREFKTLVPVQTAL